jgi:hypothetical protein
MGEQIPLSGEGFVQHDARDDGQTNQGDDHGGFLRSVVVVACGTKHSALVILLEMK